VDGVPGDAASSISVRVEEGGAVWTGAAGVSDLASQAPVDPAGYFRIGSVSKSFTAALVLILVDQGLIDLDTPFQEYLPDILAPADDPITVRHLLQHTSGLADYELRVGMDNPAAIVEQRDRTYPLDELIALALDQPRLFAPGTNQAYASTNYLLLQALIEQVTGESYGAALQRLVLDPAGLTQTFAPGSDPALPEPYAHGYITLPQHGESTPVDISAWNASVAAASGELVSTLADLSTFLKALLAGEIVPAPLLDEMLTRFPDAQLGPGAAYGLGITLLEMPCDVTIYGHGGSVPGYGTQLYSTRDGSRSLALSITTLSYGGQTGQAMNALRTTTFCGAP
jgi:D-alanyl-D-alanine carboxypeptidase